MSAVATIVGMAFLAQASAAPTSAETWEWDPKVPICTLKQSNPSDAAPVTIERTPGGEETELEITLPSGNKIEHGHFLDATVRTENGRSFLADLSVWARREDGKLVLYVDSPDPAFVDNLANSAWLEFSHPKTKTLRVPIHIPAKIVATLRDCEDTTMRDWGIDPIAWRALRSRPMPIGHVRERFSALDYPMQELSRNVEADAVTRLDIGIDGRVAKCAAATSGLSKDFELASCAVLKGARFRPAIDSSGRPVPASIVYDVRFRIGS